MKCKISSGGIIDGNGPGRRESGAPATDYGASGAVHNWAMAGSSPYLSFASFLISFWIRLASVLLSQPLLLTFLLAWFFSFMNYSLLQRALKQRAYTPPLGFLCSRLSPFYGMQCYAPADVHVKENHAQRGGRTCISLITMVLQIRKKKSGRFK